MSVIPQNNFRIFLSKEFDLSSYVITDSMETIHRFNIFSRISQSKYLDSKNICKNIELTLNQIQTLSGEEKEMAIKNLNNMRNKFSKSSDYFKAEECKKIIDRVTSKIHVGSSRLPSSHIIPHTNTVSSKTSKDTKKKVEKQNPEAEKRTQPNRVTVSQTHLSSQAKSILSQTQDPYGAQKNLVTVISLCNKKTETTTVSSQLIVPNMTRIAKIEEGVTELDRKQHNFTRHLVYYRHEDKYYFNALKVKNENGFRTCTQTLVEAQEIKQQIQKIKENGVNDIGALLRERMKEMNIGFSER